MARLRLPDKWQGAAFSFLQSIYDKSGSDESLYSYHGILTAFFVSGLSPDAVTKTDIETFINRASRGRGREGRPIAPEEVIPAYQAILFLDEKYDLTQSEKGCLSAWFGGIQKSADQSDVRGIADVFGQLVYAGQQRDFWEKELPKVEKVEGLSKKKKKAPLPIPVNS